MQLQNHLPTHLQESLSVLVDSLGYPQGSKYRKISFNMISLLTSRIGLLLLFCLIGIGTLHANNILVTNADLTGRNTSAGTNNVANYTMVRFDLSWENSWRSSFPANWDAAWVFAKFRLGDTDYLSAPGATNSGTTITVHSTVGLRPGMPVFVQSGTGAFAAGTVITSITNATTFEVSSALTTPLSAKAVVRAERIWEHCWLHDSGHQKGSIGAGASVQAGLKDETAAFDAVNNPAVGAYFYRSADGTGTFSTTGAQLRWNYGAQGIKDDDIVQIKVFAIEMVYVPQGNFQLDVDFAENVSDKLILTGEPRVSGSTTITDYSQYNRTVTPNAVQMTTAQAQTGTHSLSFNGSTSLTVPANVDFNFGAGDFTVEAWVRPSTISGNRSVFAISGAGSASVYVGGFSILMLSGRFAFDFFGNCYSPNGSCPAWRMGNVNVRSVDTWYHVAVTRQVDTFRLFVDGIQEGTSVVTSSGMQGGYAPSLGATPTNGWGPSFSRWEGHVDDLRVVKGVARYTANFTPPAGPPSLVAAGYTISSENPITLGGNTPGNLMYSPLAATGDDFNSSVTQTLPAAFPKGYAGFYTMKYEITQQQWIHFFNTLTTIQQPALDITDATGKNNDNIVFRNNIRWTTGDATLNSNTYGNVPCNYLGWKEAMAYTDWAGMRPMTELEFEKAARGTKAPIIGELVTGRTEPSLIGATGVSNIGQATEVPSNATANAIFNNHPSVQGPLRSGALATATGSSRVKAHGSFWGVLDLGGNLAEQVVSMGSSDGRGYTGLHGDGSLTVAGYADVSNWPGLAAGAVTGATGAGTRGGSWKDQADLLKISDRSQVNVAPASRLNNNGARAVRTLPTSAVL